MTLSRALIRASRGINKNLGRKVQPGMMREIQPVTCPFCSLLCNDLRLIFDEGALAAFSTDCVVGEAGFRLAVDDSTHEEPTQAVLETSLRTARTWLQEARQPLVVLAGTADTEAISAAVRLAKRTSAILACDEDWSGSVLGLSMQKAGWLTDTLRELRSQSLVVLCGVDPARTHPRLGELLGRDLKTDSLQFDPADPLEALRWLRVARSKSTEPIPAWCTAVHTRIEAACSGLVVFGQEWLKVGNPFTTELLLWLKDLNKEKHWYALYLPPAPNSSGVVETLLSETGFPGNMHLRSRKLDFSPRVWRAENVIQQGGADVCILVGKPGSFSEETLSLLSQSRTILLDAERPAWNPPVWLPSARVGVECSGRFQRLDGVPVELQPVLPSRRRTMKDLLYELADEEHPL